MGNDVNNIVGNLRDIRSCCELVADSPDLILAIEEGSQSHNIGLDTVHMSSAKESTKKNEKKMIGYYIANARR